MAAPRATAAPPPEFEPIEYGASLMLAWQVRGKPVLVIGGGAVAAGRIQALLAADALVTLISPYSGLSPEVLYRLEVEKSITTYHDRVFAGEEDLVGFEMVLTAIDEIGLSSTICTMCRRLRIAVNVADVPPECDFYFGSIVRRGPLQIMVSTGGKGPRIANRVRLAIQDNLPENVGEAIESVGRLRGALRAIAPEKDTETIARRMDWMIRVCDKWSLDDLAAMSDETRLNVLEGWESGRAKSYWDAKGGPVGTLLGTLGAGRCPVKQSPDGKKLRYVGCAPTSAADESTSCPFILGTSGLVVGATSALLGLFVVHKYWK